MWIVKLLDADKEGLHVLQGIGMKWKARWSQFWEKYWWTPLLGPPYEGEWRAPNGPSSMFLPRFGTMFDEYRGKPLDLT